MYVYIYMYTYIYIYTHTHMSLVLVDAQWVTHCHSLIESFTRSRAHSLIESRGAACARHDHQLAVA